MTQVISIFTLFDLLFTYMAMQEPRQLGVAIDTLDWVGFAWREIWLQIKSSSMDQVSGFSIAAES